MNKKIKAFTLAEVLVTLTIIGVVSALTIPTLTRKMHSQKTINLLKSTYSILGQAIHSAERENGQASEWTTERWTEKGAIEVAENLKPFFKIQKDCGTYDANNECVNSEYLQRKGIKHDVNYATDRRYYKIVLLNGASLIWKATDESEYQYDKQFTILVDINNSQPPNKWGEDLFAFNYGKNKLIPSGDPGSNAPYDKECLPKDSTGWGCAYYVLTKNKMDY